MWCSRICRQHIVSLHCFILSHQISWLFTDCKFVLCILSSVNLIAHQPLDYYNLIAFFLFLPVIVNKLIWFTNLILTTYQPHTKQPTDDILTTYQSHRPPLPPTYRLVITDQINLFTMTSLLNNILKSRLFVGRSRLSDSWIQENAMGPFERRRSNISRRRLSEPRTAWFWEGCYGHFYCVFVEHF